MRAFVISCVVLATLAGGALSDGAGGHHHHHHNRPLKVRKVLRRGRGHLVPTAVAAETVPLLNFRAPAPLPLAPAPLPLAPPVPIVPALAPTPFASFPRQQNSVLVTPEPVPEVVELVEVRQPTLEYGAPATVAPEVRQPVDSYAQPQEARNGYGAPAEEEIVEVVEVRDGYLAAADEPVVAVRNDYAAAVIEQPAVEVRSEPARYQNRVANVKSNIALPQPIAIVRSQYNPPAEKAVFDYSFEAENGIKQEAVGTLRIVDDTEVSVMSGSYSYVGADGLNYQVDWYADETGFHPSAPHLPKPVEPNHPEVAAAVRAQLAFAAEEDAAAARSNGALSGYGSPLAEYN